MRRRQFWDPDDFVRSVSACPAIQLFFKFTMALQKGMLTSSATACSSFPVSTSSRFRFWGRASFLGFVGRVRPAPAGDMVSRVCLWSSKRATSGYAVRSFGDLIGLFFGYSILHGCGEIICRRRRCRGSTDTDRPYP